MSRKVVKTKRRRQADCCFVKDTNALEKLVLNLTASKLNIKRRNHTYHPVINSWGCSWMLASHASSYVKRMKSLIGPSMSNDLDPQTFLFFWTSWMCMAVQMQLSAYTTFDFTLFSEKCLCVSCDNLPVTNKVRKVEWTEKVKAGEKSTTYTETVNHYTDMWNLVANNFRTTPERVQLLKLWKRRLIGLKTHFVSKRSDSATHTSLIAASKWF